ncbi:MAG: AIR synthase related protein [Fretibacterium sp.]|uniref:AIR synthase related protein n=1 Tax=Fretibacterium sp. OH1220_COT-178 TaxID=2491047 RepID=UPI000F5E7B1F|nr:AIR synthase related protein [Fretibacterium sp. OH1220_COT-178]MDO4785440.1 AIR synthase related protein [Fretibacterium sp.]RRD65680.1 hydrogenase expression protein [Fretibacterium sp. OH1220_COT-178]
MLESEKTIVGKLPPDLLLQGVLRYSGAPRPDVPVGGGLGEDAAVIQWSDAPYLVAASDPVVGATVGAGRLLVHINANDVACKGADPAWLIVTLIVPSNEGLPLIERIMAEVHETCADMGIAVVGGHTELTDRYDRPVIVGTMLGPSRRILSADRIEEGDLVLVTGHAGLEGMSILAHDRPDLLSCLEPSELEEVRSWQGDLSVVREARLLRDFARYLHDPTEGGLEGGLLEIRNACGLGIALDFDAIPVSPLTRRAATAIGFDPLHLISSGMLVAALPPDGAEEARACLAHEGIDSKIIGRFVEPRGACRTDMHEELWGILARERA